MVTSRAYQLMWQAIKGGESRAYAYLGWMHHHGHIGGHAPPDEQPEVPSDNNWEPKSEYELLSEASKRWGGWLFDRELHKSTEKVKARTAGKAIDKEQQHEDVVELKPGEDIWGGIGGEDVIFDWVLLGGGVSGAKKAALLYEMGAQVSTLVGLSREHDL